MSLALSRPWCRRDVGSIKLSKVYCKTNPLILRRLVSWSSWNTDFVMMLKPEEFCSCGVTESARVGHFYAPQQLVTSLCNSSLTLTGWAAVLSMVHLWQWDWERLHSKIMRCDLITVYLQKEEVSAKLAWPTDPQHPESHIQNKFQASLKTVGKDENKQICVFLNVTFPTWKSSDCWKTSPKSLFELTKVTDL